jgi:hypothetical protein
MKTWKETNGHLFGYTQLGVTAGAVCAGAGLVAAVAVAVSAQDLCVNYCIDYCIKFPIILCEFVG